MLPAIALVAALGGASLTALPAHEATAQAVSPAPQAPATPPEAQRRIEDRINHLKSRLQITSAQETLWNSVADVMRQNAQQMRQTFVQLRGDRNQPFTALQRLESESRFAKASAEATDRLLAAFRPLYDRLSDEQKKVADSLYRHRRGRF